MPWFEGTHTETRTLSASPEAARDHFADLAAIVAATKDVVRSEIEGDTIHFVLKAENHGVTTFQPDYRCVYAVDGDSVRWQSGGGNLDQRGRATFRAAPGGCVLTYTETIRLDLGVPKLMAPMIKPVVAAMVASEIKEFVNRMVAPLT